jgi:hypothetical protein
VKLEVYKFITLYNVVLIIYCLASWKVSNDTHAFNSLAKGMYYPALVPFLQQFSSSQIFIMRTEDILLNPSSSFQQLAKFLEIDPTYFAERNFYQGDELLTEEELISIAPKTRNFEQELVFTDNASTLSPNLFIRPTKHKVMMSSTNTLNYPFLSNTLNQELLLSTRYRLQRVFRHLNNRLLEIFDHNKMSFLGWVYDVDRG